jgi:hypothetical protein
MPVTGIGSSAAADSVAALVSSLNTASAATTAAATAATAAGNSATAASQYDAVVHPSASIGYSTVTAALAAIPTGGRILVKSSTTETLSITKRCIIEWVGGAQLINSGATDTITTGVAENANGAVADVKLINPWLTNTLSDTVLGTGLALAASGDTVTSAAHGLVAGKQVQLANVTATGVSAAVTYFVVSPTTNTFKLSLTYGGSAVDITVDGTADVTVLGRNAAAGFNLHGALRWRIENAKVEYHAKGVYFSATPYPSGQGSHNTFRSLFISNCGVGVHNGGQANINNLYDLYTYNCSKHLWHESGLNLNIFGHRAENLAGGTEEMIALEAAGTFLYGLHAEGQGANPVLRLGSACRAVVEGDIYITTGVRYLITSGLATRSTSRVRTTWPIPRPAVSRSCQPP